MSNFGPELNEQETVEFTPEPETTEVSPAEVEKPTRNYGKRAEGKTASDRVSIITVGRGIDCKVKGPATGAKYQNIAGQPLEVDAKDAAVMVAGGQWRYASA